ncbi:MAG: type II secretion system secretin GspD [Pseudomonadota bacterium]
MYKLKEILIINLILIAMLSTSLFSEPRLFDPSAAKKEQAEEKVNLDFSDQDIVDVAKQIAVLIDKNIIIDPAVSGKRITLISPKKVTIKEAYNAFLAAINMQGITVIDSGNFLKIVKVDTIKQQSSIGTSDGIVKIDESYATQMIEVKYIDANKLKEAITSMVSKGGIEVYAPTNTLIITDTISNIKRIRKVIASLDVEGFEERVEFITLKYAPAKQVAEKLTQLLNISSSSSSSTSYSSRYSKYAKTGTASTFSDTRKKTITSIIADERTNSIIVKATEKGLIEVQNLIKKLDTDLTNDQNAVKPFFYHLEHTEAVKVSEVLSSILSSTKSYKSRYGTSSKYGASSYTAPNPSGGSKIGGEDIKVTADEPTNSLIIVATQQGYDEIIPIIMELDKKRKQVNIAAAIMEVSTDDNFKLGASGHGGYDANGYGVFGGSQHEPGSIDPSKAAGLSGLILGLTTAPIELGSGFSLPAIGALFNASQGVTDVKLLQKPNITTLDNNEATINIGKEVYVQVGATSPTNANEKAVPTYEKQDVTLMLKIKPKVNNSSEVTMEIEQNIRDSAGQDKISGRHMFTKRDTKTIAMANSGETIAIGGIISDKVETTVSKTPILGDIPVLGYLFKHKYERKSKVNLIIFITPTVLEDSKDISDLTKATLEDRNKMYQKMDIEVDDWVGSNKADTHPAGIVINYGSESKTGNANNSNNAENYFSDSSDGISTYEVEVGE